MSHKRVRILGRQVHNTLFGEVEVLPDKKPGRDQEVLAKRDKRFAYRYDFYRRNFQSNEYTWILERLSEEFDLTVYTAGWLVDGLSDLILQAKRESLTSKELCKLWWWMEWEVTKIPLPVIMGK